MQNFQMIHDFIACSPPTSSSNPIASVTLRLVPKRPQGYLPWLKKIKDFPMVPLQVLIQPTPLVQNHIYLI